MAATAPATKVARIDRHLTVARPGSTARREQALSRVRDARRKLEGRQEGDRFAHLRRMHD